MKATARIVARFGRSAAPRRFSGDVRGTVRPSHRPALLVLPATLLAVVAALLAIAALDPAAALAAQTHVFTGSFGSAGSGAGQLELAEHSGLAVNEATHDLYVADTGNHWIDKFDSAGNFIRALIGGLPTGAPA